MSQAAVIVELQGAGGVHQRLLVSTGSRYRRGKERTGPLPMKLLLVQVAQLNGKRLRAGQFYPLILWQGKNLADNIRANGQLAGVDFQQAHQGYAGRAAIVKQFVEGGTDRKSVV